MATLKTVLYKSKTYSDGSHPLMAQITSNRKVYRLSIGLKLYPNEWSSTTNKLVKPRASKSKVTATLRAKIDELYRNRTIQIKNFEDRIESYLIEIAAKNDVFRIESLRDYLKQDQGNTDKTVKGYYDKLITNLKEDSKVGTAKSYQETINSLMSFHKNEKLSFFDIDVKFLKRYEKYLIERGGSDGGVNFRMRNVRAAVNSAIAEKILPAKYYPFSRHKLDKLYKMPKSKSNPRAMSIDEFNLFVSLDLDKHPHLIKYYNYALFSYYSRGMNFIDMAKLRHSDIYNDRITFVRSKTKSTASIPCTDRHLNIIESFDGLDDKHVFPILHKDRHKTEQQIKDRVKKCLTQFNKGLKEIGSILKIETPLSSYTFRHQYASVLKAKGVSVDIISRNMDHASVKVTKVYLKSLGYDLEGDKADELL